MNKTELLALAERLDEICGEHGDIDAVSLRSAAAILRKLAALVPVERRVCPLSSTELLCEDLCANKLYNLTGVLDE